MSSDRENGPVFGYEAVSELGEGVRLHGGGAVVHIQSEGGVQRRIHSGLQKHCFPLLEHRGAARGGAFICAGGAQKNRQVRHCCCCCCFKVGAEQDEFTRHDTKGEAQEAEAADAGRHRYPGRHQWLSYNFLLPDLNRKT